MHACYSGLGLKVTLTENSRLYSVHFLKPPEPGERRQDLEQEIQSVMFVMYVLMQDNS